MQAILPLIQFFVLVSLTHASPLPATSLPAYKAIKDLPGVFSPVTTSQPTTTKDSVFTHGPGRFIKRILNIEGVDKPIPTNSVDISVSDESTPDEDSMSTQDHKIESRGVGSFQTAGNWADWFPDYLDLPDLRDDVIQLASEAQHQDHVQPGPHFFAANAESQSRVSQSYLLPVKIPHRGLVLAVFMPAAVQELSTGRNEIRSSSAEIDQEDWLDIAKAAMQAFTQGFQKSRGGYIPVGSNGRLAVALFMTGSNADRWINNASTVE